MLNAVSITMKATVVEGHRGLEPCSFRSIGIGTDIISASFDASLEGGDAVPLQRRFTMRTQDASGAIGGRRTQLTQTDSDTVEYADGRDEGGVNGI